MDDALLVRARRELRLAALRPVVVWLRLRRPQHDASPLPLGIAVVYFVKDIPRVSICEEALVRLVELGLDVYETLDDLRPSR